MFSVNFIKQNDDGVNETKKEENITRKEENLTSGQKNTYTAENETMKKKINTGLSYKFKGKQTHTYSWCV